MRFKINNDQLTVFKKQKFIELEDFFSLHQLGDVFSHIQQLLSKRLRHLTETSSPIELFRAGHDLWRDDPLLHRFVCNRGIADLVSELTQQQKISLAFDQILQTSSQIGLPEATPLSLQQKSCIQPLAAGVLIRLSGSSPYSLFPQKQENIVIFSPDLVIPWETFFQQPLQSFLLIAYAPPKALYIFEKNDPHVHTLKKLGYVFGDTLKPDLHPILR